MITLERLDELQHEKGAPVTRDELIELATAHRICQRVGRTLTGHLRRVDSMLGDLEALVGAPEPATLVAAEPFVEPVITDEEVEGL